MTVKYEWKVGRNGTRKYVRSIVNDAVVPMPILAPDPPVVAEIVAEPEPAPVKRGPGRPKKVDSAPVVIEDADDE